MNHILVLSVVTLATRLASGSNQIFTFPVDEDPDYDSICANSSVVINFSGLQLKSIKKNFLSSPVVHCLDLSDNRVESIDGEAFHNLPNLKFLNISNNEFDINSIFTHGHPNLETLILDNNGNNCGSMQRLNINATYPRLKKLFIRNNCKTVNFYSTSKTAFSSLTHLYLHGTSIGPFFQWLPSTLEYLDLSDHSIADITLQNLDNLKYLAISDPLGKGLSILNLQGLTSLKYLSAVSNGPVDILEFPIVPSLVFLDFSYNSLQSMKAATLYHMTNLQFFNLSYNCIESVEEGTFDRLANLEVLVLEGNRLTATPKLPNEKLRVLFLNCNDIKGVDAGAFKKLRLLESLYLHGNKITYVDPRAFLGLGNLETLTLSHNKLKSLPQNWMLPLESLRDLRLGNNMIYEFKDIALTELSPLEYLRLSDPIGFEPTDLSNGMPKNLSIYINSDTGYLFDYTINDLILETCKRDALNDVFCG